MPDIDIFASRINCKLPTYVSWYPDPGCYAVDAFSLSWVDHFIYSFPPFSLIARTLRKIMTEKVDAILIAPLWPTQCWYPIALNLLTCHPIVFPATARNVYLPHKPHMVHPLSPGLHFMALKLSGDSSKCRIYRLLLKSLSLTPDGPVPDPNMRVLLPNGKGIVSNGMLIPYTLI